MRLGYIDRYQERQRQKLGVVKLDSIEDLVKLMIDDRDMALRQVNPTQLAYILSDVRYKAYMGPAGCAKTTTGVVDVLLRALLMPGTKWFIARKNYNDLLDTTLRTAINVLNRLPAGTLIDRSKAPPMKWWIKPIVMGGTRPDDVEPSEITFMGLTDSVGSYEFNGGFIDEADEVDAQFVNELKGRLRYKPSPDYPDENYFIGLAFNPPSMAHWLYGACTGKDVEGNDVQDPWLTVFRPQPKENQRNLPTGYYESMTKTLPEDLRQRLVEGIWGNTYPGEAVVRQFRRSLHVRPGLQYKRRTLYRFMDFGYNNPGCLWAQATNSGRLEVLQEFKGTKLEGERFAEEIIRRTADSFTDVPNIIDFGDPAVAQTKDTGQMLAILNRAGILLRYQRTPFDVSMNLLRKQFEKLVDGEPGILIDDSCRVLIDGLAGGYHFKKDGITPDKSGIYDHLVDALRYGVYNLFGVNISSTHGIPSSLSYWSKR